MAVNLKSLIARLNDACRSALEGAAGLCLLAHQTMMSSRSIFLLKLVEAPDTDIRVSCGTNEINQSRVTKIWCVPFDKLMDRQRAHAGAFAAPATVD